jgi:hypothetical protein
MPKLNERLSHWDALNGCFCGRWQKSPKAVHLYERSGEPQFSRIFADVEKVAACEVCGYDLTREPMENLKAMTAKDWSGALIKGSCFSSESGWQLPEGITDCEFTACNLDNVVLPVDAKGITLTACSRKRIITQNDRADWVCDWKTGEPLEPVDLKRRIREGENTDPAKLPVAKLTDEELKALEQKRRDERELAEAQAKVSELTVKLAEVAAPEAVK